MILILNILQSLREPDSMIAFWVYAILCLCVYLAISRISKRLNWNNKTPMVIIYLMYIIIVLEIGLRLIGKYDTYLERKFNRYESLYKFRPNKLIYKRESNQSFFLESMNEFKYEFKTNSKGYSDIEWDTIPSRNFKIIALGDSFTEGVGAPQDSSWVAQIRKYYKNKDIYWLNCGISASDPFNNFYNLQNDIIRMHPDLVIQIFTNQDFEEDVLLRGGFERFKKGHLEYKPAPCRELVYAYSHIYRMFFHWKTSRTNYIDLEELENYQISTKIKELTQLYSDWSTENKIPVVLIYFNNSFQYDNYGMANPEYESIDHKNVFLKSLRLCYKNEYEVLGNTMAHYWWPNDGHHNSEGYKLMSKCVHEAVGAIVDSLYAKKMEIITK